MRAKRFELPANTAACSAIAATVRGWCRALWTEPGEEVEVLPAVGAPELDRATLVALLTPDQIQLAATGKPTS